MIDIMAKNDEKNKKNIDFSSNVNRIEWIDIAKGIGIILVVIGHNFSDGENIIYLRKWIYSFHMPLFFLLSGILFSAKQESFKDFFFKRVRTLLLPYIIFAAISLALFISSYLIVSKINPNIMVDQNKNFINLIFGVFYSKNVNNFLDINIPIWFITCMFIVQLFFFFFKKIIKRDVFIILLALITSVLSYFLFSKIYLPWSIDTALIGVLFFSIGFGIKKYDLINKITRSKLVLVFLSILTFCVTVFISQLNPVVIMAENIYGNYILFLISSAVGILFVIFISLLIKKSVFLSFLGKNSLIILGFHILFIFNIRSIISLIFQLPQKAIVSDFYISLIIFLITMILCVPTIFVWNKLFLKK